MILFSKDKTEIEYHKEVGILEIRWIGLIQFTEFSKLWNKISLFLNKYNLKYLLIDSTNLDNTILLQDERFILHFLKECAATSLEKVARVGSVLREDVFEVDSFYKEVNTKLPRRLRFKQFRHQYEAMDWLLEKSDTVL